VEARSPEAGRSDARSGRPKQARSRATRARVIDAMADRIEAQGYERTSMAEIALHAGIGTGTLYHHFPDKRAILLELMEVWGERLASERRSHLQIEALIEEDPRAAIAGILRRIHKRLQGGNWLYAEIFRLLDRDDEVRVRYEQFQRLGIERFAAIVEFGQRRGLLRSGPDPQTASLLVINAIDLLMSHVVLLRRSPEDVERVLCELTDMLCRYLVADS